MASPKIPNFLYMCVHEIDARLNEEGIYRINGSTTGVEELKRKMLGGEIRKEDIRNIVDTNVICSTVKGFFRNMLNEPILTYSQMPSFIRAFENNDSNLTKDLFQEVTSTLTIASILTQ